LPHPRRFTQTGRLGKELILRLPDLIKRLAASIPMLGLATMLSLATGCETKSFLDPSELGRFNPQPTVVPILKTLDVGLEETDNRFVSATPPTRDDMEVRASDYVIGPNDLLQVSIEGLVQAGFEQTKVTRVTQSGYISLPILGQIKAAGLTEAQLEQAVIQGYRDRNILPNAQVSVITAEARSRTFTVGGAVQRPGQYTILDPNFHVLDAVMNYGGGVTSDTGIDFIYVLRQRSVDQLVPQTASPQAPVSQPSGDILAPRSEGPAVNAPKLMQAEAPTAPGTEGRTVTVDGQPMQIQSGQMVNDASANTATSVPPTSEPFEFNDLSEPSDVRVIRIPFEALRRGEFKYNIVIRPQDFIYVPGPVVGEYYMGGHVQRTGVYNLSARNITLRQAVIAAGGLDQLAIPERTEIVRKVEPFKQVYARVNLAKVFSGEEPDILLKPDDQVMVGTNALAPFLAAFRNGFRITYGFGFLYDKNFNQDDNNQ
jgi:polysaccharide export outer membrane protein